MCISVVIRLIVSSALSKLDDNSDNTDIGADTIVVRDNNIINYDHYNAETGSQLSVLIMNKQCSSR